MKVCFIGVGSIAKRHIKNLKSIMGDEVTIDVYRHSGGEIFPNVNCQYTDLESIPSDYDAIFITNPTSMHMGTLEKVANKSNYFFIEKPVRTLRHMGILSESIPNIEKNKVCYVACPLRYTRVIQYLKREIDWNKVYSLRAISSSYLPDWRPNTDYRDGYSARKELGGGVASDLIHEWDYISYLIGLPKRVFHLEKKVSNLDISAEDVALYIGEYDDKTVEIHLDYFGREEIRNIEIFTSEETIQADLVQNRICYLRSGKMIQFEEERDDYQIEELRHFFDICRGEIDNDNDIVYADKLMSLLED